MDSPKKNALAPWEGGLAVKSPAQLYSTLIPFGKTVKQKSPGALISPCFFLFFLFLVFVPFGEAREGVDSYAKGLKAFREGQGDEASIYFHEALTRNPSHDGAFLYLGILAQNRGRYEDAGSWYSQGRRIKGPHCWELTFNLANLYVNQHRYGDAMPLYKEILEDGGALRPLALLNLANVHVNQQNYEEAVKLYQGYLFEQPEAGQRAQIERMVTLLKEFMDKKRKEEERLAEEARRREQEERQRLEEEARQKALLDEILNNLQQTADDTENFKAGSEQVEERFEESDLDD